MQTSTHISRLRPPFSWQRQLLLPGLLGLATGLDFLLHPLVEELVSGRVLVYAVLACCVTIVSLANLRARVATVSIAVGVLLLCWAAARLFLYPFFHDEPLVGLALVYFARQIAVLYVACLAWALLLKGLIGFYLPNPAQD